MQFLSVFLRKMKLAALWVIRILFAPNHFKVPLYKRIWHAVFGGYMADQIALYDFKNNKKREYLSEFDWYKSRSINDPYSQMLNNKVVFAEMLRPFCPCPEVYAVKKGKRIAGLHGREISNCEDLIELLLVADIDLVELHRLARDLLHALKRLLGAVAKVIDDNHLVARVEQFNDRVASDVSGSACNENLHGKSISPC